MITKLAICFLLLTTPAYAAMIDLDTIAHIESNHNPAALNPSGAAGMYQLMPCVITEYNQYHKVKYTLADRYNATKSAVIASWYLEQRIPQLLRHYELSLTVDNVLWAYNAGIGRVRKGIMPSETKHYIRKYHANCRI